MKDNRKTKAQLIQEINELRSRVSNLESGSSAQSAFPADITGRKYLEKENEHRLISLTEPEFDLTNLSLTDVLDQRMLQSLQDAFSDAFNVPSVIFDIDGSFITRPSRFSDFCALLNSTNKGARKCTVFDKKMMETLKENPVPQLRQGCVLTNMVTGIVPIMLQGRHLANWGIGQMISGEIDPDEIRQYADEIDLDSGKLAAAAGHLLPVEPDVLKRTMDFLGTLSYQLSLLAWQNLQQRRNIAARDRAEKALISERKLYIAGPTIVFRWKAADGWPVEYVSPNVESVFGITDDEFMLEGILFSSIVHPDDIIRVGAEVEMYSRDNIDSFQQEYRIVRPDGKIRWLFDITVISRNDDGSISFYEGYVLDITHHKQAQFERERLMMAIEQVAETIVITNMDAEIEYVNPAFEQITGFSRDEAIGKNPRMLQSSEHGESFYTDMWDTLQRGQIWSGHIINKKKDSTLYTEEATISPVRNSSGEVVNYIAVKRDITSEINLERQLRQAQKMEAIGHLAGGVAHDFNNLLQVINGYTDLALAYIDLDHPSRDYVKEVEKAGVRARTLISQLLSFSRQQIINPVDLDLNDVIDKFMKMLTRVIGEHIQLKFIPDDDLGIIHADRGRMEQILMNLCVNSRDALPAGGSITIETRNVFIDTSFTILNLGSKPGRHILLSVTDNGCGIDEDTISSIFDPFFTTKTVGNGTGLGLSTVYGIVKQHNGDIQVYSEPDRGTVFSIYLPTVQRKAAHISPESNASVPIGMETILIAEDDDMVRNLTRETLVMAGYTVLDARNGEDALSIYHGNEDLIDLLILDVVMPGMGGKEVYNRIMESNPDIRTLFCSGYNRNAIHTGFVLDKDLHFIQKPFNSDVLLRKIRTILDS